MSNVTNIRHAMPVSAEISKAASGLDSAIIKEIDDAKAAGLPQGLIVGLLHGHAHAQTRHMVTQ